MSYLPGSAIPAPVLIAIAPSQTTEVVRWSLDRLGIPYREEDHVPVFHVLFTWLTTCWLHYLPTTHRHGQGQVFIRLEDQTGKPTPLLVAIYLGNYV